MEKTSTLKLLLYYCIDRRKILLLFLLQELIFCMVCVLYQLDGFSKLLYGVYLSLFMLFCYGVWDFSNYRKRLIKLYEATLNTENISQLLPQATNNQEKQYQTIINILFTQQQQLIFSTDLKESQMADYYTLWVHQIKTPIAAMKLLLQNDDKEYNPFPLSKELFKIEQYAEMVLHYLRIESISSDMLLKEYNLKNILNQAVKKYSVLFISSKLNFNLHSFDCIIVTDEKWLIFILEQFISNALKYTTTGGISIYMDANRPTTLIIEDTGIGIRPEDLPRIFDRGFTGYNGRIDKKSTGIGLYLCDQISNKLSHTITVTSELGKGTKVFIDFSRKTLRCHRK